jgi:hypothetical protein
MSLFVFKYDGKKLTDCSTLPCVVKQLTGTFLEIRQKPICYGMPLLAYVMHYTSFGFPYRPPATSSVNNMSD